MKAANSLWSLREAARLYVPGRVAAATLLAALAVASGLLTAAAMTSLCVAAPLRGLLSCPRR